VGTADAHTHPIIPHPGPQKVAAVDRGDPQLPGTDKFAVVLRDGGGVDDGIRTLHLLGTVTHKAGNAHSTKPPR